MMIKAKGPVWHKKQKDQGIVPKGLRGLDKDATWGKSRADGWVYGHGTFSLTPHGIPIVGIFQWMRNSANEAKRMKDEIIKYAGIIKKVFMDSKADDQEGPQDPTHHFASQRHGQVAGEKKDDQGNVHETKYGKLQRAIRNR